MKSILIVIVGIYDNQFKCNYLRNKKSELFAAFLKPKSTFKYFEKKMTFIPYVFLKLQAAKDGVRWMFKKSDLWKPFKSNHAKESETHLKSAWQHFYHIS